MNQNQERSVPAIPFTMLLFALAAAALEFLWNWRVRRRGAAHDAVATIIYAAAGFWGGLRGSVAYGVVLGLTTAAFDAAIGLVLWTRLAGGSLTAPSAPEPIVVIGTITLWGGLVGWVAAVAASLTPWSRQRH